MVLALSSQHGQVIRDYDSLSVRGKKARSWRRALIRRGAVDVGEWRWG
jgi:hypothetical protein